MITFKIEEDGNQFHAFCPELKGCHTFGASRESAMGNLKNAIQLYLEDEMESQTVSAFVNQKENHVTV